MKRAPKANRATWAIVHKSTKVAGLIMSWVRKKITRPMIPKAMTMRSHRSLVDQIPSLPLRIIDLRAAKRASRAPMIAKMRLRTDQGFSSGVMGVMGEVEEVGGGVVGDVV